MLGRGRLVALGLADSVRVRLVDGLAACDSGDSLSLCPVVGRALESSPVGASLDPSSDDG